MSANKYSDRPLSWDLIKSFFSGHWVELHNADWVWGARCPARAQVRHHARSRKELIEKIQASGSLADSVVVFVGPSTMVVRSERADQLVAQ